MQIVYAFAYSKNSRNKNCGSSRASMVPHKLQQGANAVGPALINELHPLKLVHNKFPNQLANQWLDWLNVVQEDNKKVWKVPKSFCTPAWNIWWSRTACCESMVQNNEKRSTWTILYRVIFVCRYWWRNRNTSTRWKVKTILWLTIISFKTCIHSLKLMTTTSHYQVSENMYDEWGHDGTCFQKRQM